MLPHRLSRDSRDDIRSRLPGARRVKVSGEDWQWGGGAVLHTVRRRQQGSDSCGRKNHWSRASCAVRNHPSRGSWSTAGSSSSGPCSKWIEEGQEGMVGYFGVDKEYGTMRRQWKKESESSREEGCQLFFSQ